jgi:hypothetical protein
VIIKIIIGTRADPGFNATKTHQKNPNYRPFGNTYEVDEVSPEVEAGVVAGLKCLQPYLGHRSVIIILNRALSINSSSTFNQ